MKPIKFDALVAKAEEEKTTIDGQSVTKYLRDGKEVARIIHTDPVKRIIFQVES